MTHPLDASTPVRAPRGNRLRRLWRKVAAPGTRRRLHRLLALAVVLACLLEPLTPVAAYRPAAPLPSSPHRPPAPAPSQPVEVEPGMEVGTPGAGPAVDTGTAGLDGLGTLSVVPGIGVYDQADVNCDSPQYPERSPTYSEIGTTGSVHQKSFILCSQGVTVHVTMLAEAQGAGYYPADVTDVYLQCYSGGCSGFVAIHPAKVATWATNLDTCARYRSHYEGDVYLPPGKYEMRALARNGPYNPLMCSLTSWYRLYLEVAPPRPSVARCFSGECPLAQNSDKFGFDPVNSRTGSFTRREVDFDIPTRGLPLTFERTYNSMDKEEPSLGPLGRGWTHNYCLRLVTDTMGMTLVAPHGSRLPFYKRADGSFAAGPGVRATLVRNADGTYTLTQSDQVVYTFAAGGRLNALCDTHGNTTTLTYTGANLTAITAPDGRALTLTYNGPRISKVTGPLSRSVSFTYTGADNMLLYRATDVRGKVWEYRYINLGGMSGVIDPAGHRVTNIYDDLGRVITQKDEVTKQTTTFTYYADRTVLTDANGVQTTHVYDTNGMLVSVADGLGHTTWYEHDANYNVAAVTDPLSRTTRYTWSACGCSVESVEDALGQVVRMGYDGHNNLTSVTDPLTRTTRFAYDAYDKLIAVTNTLGLTATFSYNAFGQLVAAHDAHGHATQYAYDQYGNPSLITDTLGHATRLTYDAAGQLTALTDANSHTTLLAYDPSGRPLTVTNALNGRSLYGYDSVGRLTQVTDPASRITRFAYDAAGRLITVTNALNGRTIYRYDNVDRVTRITDANGKATDLSYDAAGRLITVTNALNGKLVYAYDDAGNVIRATDERGKPSYFAYDGLNRTVAITDTLGHATRFAYDAVGNLRSALDPTGVLVEYTFDDLDRLTEVTGPLGRMAAYGYDAVGNLTSLTDANGRETIYGYDPLERLETVLDPLDGLTRYGYDPVGNLITATDALSHTTAYAYDALNRLGTVEDPLDHLTAYQYDPVGNTTVITDADQLVTRLTYDALDRLTGVQYAGATVSYGYDKVGSRVAMTDTTGTTRYVYDDLYRPLTITAPLLPAGGGLGGGAVGYRYDPAGNRTETLYPTGEGVSYAYDDVGRLERVTGWAGQVVTYTYDAAGRVLLAERSNGTSSDYGYDAAGRLAAIEHRQGDTWQARYDYELDRAGNRLAITETMAGQLPPGTPALEVIHYAYDPLDRLTEAAYAGGRRDEFAYDAVGNRLAMTVTTQGAVTTTYQYDDADRLTGIDDVPIAYDNRGNQLGDGTWTYTYNPAGRMVRAESVSATHVYTYNGDGLLVAQNLASDETAFTWDLALALPQVLATSDGLRALYGRERLGVLAGGAWQYPLQDHLGSMRLWADPQGAVAAVQSYAPFGEPLAPLDPSAPWGFTGEWHDPAGLLYLRARWYNLALGRFGQVDPDPGVLGLPTSQHAYGYVGSNPLRYHDPSGELDPFDVLAITLDVVSIANDVREIRQGGWTTERRANLVLDTAALVADVALVTVPGVGGGGHLGAEALRPLVRRMGGRAAVATVQAGARVVPQVLHGTQAWLKTYQAYRAYRIGLDLLLQATAGPPEGGGEPTSCGSGGAHEYDASGWHEGSFSTPEESVEYHFRKHGEEVGAKDVQDYIRKAQLFGQNLKRATKRHVQGAMSGVIRYSKAGKYIDVAPDGRIVSFGSSLQGVE